MKVIIAGGGTGGHLFPGIAIAREFIKRNKETAILFIGTKKGLEKKIIPKEGFELKMIMIEGIKGKKFYKRVFGVLKIPVSIIQSLWILKKFKPNVVVGVGGYASFPAVIASKILRVPSMIQEQNSIPGSTNRILGNWVQKIAVSFPQTVKFFPEKKTVVTGNPVRSEFLEAKDTKVSRPSRKFTVFAFGGSQGASAINQSLLDSLDFLEDKKGIIHFVHQTGKNDYEKVLRGYQEKGFTAEVFPFIENIAKCYLKSDLVISRAGATTISELSVCGIPAILIPFPHAVGNHQEINAKSFVKSGAADMIIEKKLNGKSLSLKIKGLMDDENRRKEMSRFSKRHGKLDAANQIVDICYELAGC